MKLSIAVLMCGAGAMACSHDSPPPKAVASPVPPPAERVETAQVSESAPLEPGIPVNGPTVAPPAPVVAPPPDQTPLTLTPASGSASPRAVSAPLVPTDPSRDKPKNASDQESIREIRALLASDAALASIAPQITIVAREGRVWLRGQVNTAGQRAAIEKAARQAGGVLNVTNELVVME